MQDTQVATVADLEQDSLIGVQVAGVELVVVAGKEEIHVFEGRCPHQGTLLAEGYVENDLLTCRGHGWQFSCASGAKIDDARTCLHQFSAAVKDGIVLVDQAEIANWAEKHRKTGSTEAAQPLIHPEQLPAPKGLPFLGNMHQIEIDSFHLMLEAWHQQFGDLYQFKMPTGNALVIANSDIAQQILRERPAKFSRLKNIKRTLEELEVEGLFGAEGEQWRRHRDLAKHAFDVRHLREFFPTMVKVTRRLHDRWHRLASEQSPMDVQKELMRYTVDVTTNLAFGYDMNTLEAEGDRIQQHIERVFPKIASRAFLPIRYWNYIKLPSDRALENSLAELRKSIDQFIQSTRREMAENPILWEQPRNLLQALLAAQADENLAISEQEIYGNVITFLLAGEDTTANTIAWMTYFMAKFPEIQRQMQAEADAVLGDEALITDYEKINELRYIESVAHETMRLKPVAPFLGLQALEDVTISQIQIPKGMPVFLLLRPKGLEDSEFPEATVFKPERWLNYTHQDNPHHKSAFLPFGGGPRLCPGRSLALLEIKMAAAMICRHFEVARAQPDQEIPEKFVFTMTPVDLMISLHPRSPQ